MIDRGLKPLQGTFDSQIRGSHAPRRLLLPAGSAHIAVLAAAADLRR